MPEPFGCPSQGRPRLSRRVLIGIRREVDRAIALVGLPGAGKTFLGARLSARIGLPFVDTDRQVEVAAGRTVSAIFEADGEAGFRRREQAEVVALLDGEWRVLALGGGAFEDETIRRTLLATAIVIWLDAPDIVLAARIGDGAGRPLLAGRDVAAVLRTLRQQRAAHYAEAHHRVETGHGDPLEALVTLIR
jgi:shikimate kinase